MPHQGSTQALALIHRIDADQRQIPVRLLGMVIRHLLHHGDPVPADMRRHGLLHQDAHRLFVRLGARRQPERCSLVAFRDMRRTALEGCTTECADKPREACKINARIGPAPPRRRIGAEGEG